MGLLPSFFSSLIMFCCVLFYSDFVGGGGGGGGEVCVDCRLVMCACRYRPTLDLGFWQRRGSEGRGDFLFAGKSSLSVR